MRCLLFLMDCICRVNATAFYNLICGWSGISIAASSDDSICKSVPPSRLDYSMRTVLIESIWNRNWDKSRLLLLILSP
jgi:hypothetical protein